MFISYNFISYYFILKKSKYIKNLDEKSNRFISFISKIKSKVIKEYLNSKNEKLNNIGNPYGLNLFKYVIIKYFLSICLFFILFYNSKNVLLAILIFLFMFFLPDVLIYMFEKNESSRLINEISNIVQNIILSLSSNMSLHDSLNSSAYIIKYDRLKKEYLNFINKYKMYNYNILKAVNDFEKKFNTYEFNMFLSILVECEKEGQYIELLENFQKSLEVRYFKYLNLQSIKNTFVIFFAIIIALANSFIVIGYPIIFELISNVYDIFS